MKNLLEKLVLLVLLVLALLPFASSHPDGLERVVHRLGIGGASPVSYAAPLPDYNLPGGGSSPAASLLSALAGIALTLVLCVGMGLYLRTKRNSDG